MTKLMIGLMMAGALLVGCDKGGGEAKTDGTAKSGESKPASGGDSIGVKECDDYVKEVEECVKKHPEMKGMADNLPQQKQAWKQSLAVPQAKDATIQACKQLADGLKETCK